MSSTTVPNPDTYVDRITAILEANTTLFPTNGKNLVTKIHKHKPAIEQSPNDAVMPYVYVNEAERFIVDTQKVGRDSINSEGPTLYTLEIWNVIITQGETSEKAQENLHPIDVAIRNAFNTNKRLTNPADGTDPKCATHEVFSIPRIINPRQPDIQGLNVVIRPKVFVNLR